MPVVVSFNSGAANVRKDHCSMRVNDVTAKNSYTNREQPLQIISGDYSEFGACLTAFNTNSLLPLP